MHVQSYRSYTEDSSLKIPFSILAPRLLQTLDRFLSYIDTNRADLLDQLARHILKGTEDATAADLPPHDADVFKTVTAKCPYASQFPELFRAHYDLLRGLLGLEQVQWIEESAVELSQVRFIRARYLPNFIKLLAMIDVMDRQQAIELMKQYLDWAIEQSPSRPDGPQNLTELRTMQVDFNIQEAGMDWISAVIGEHQYLNKVTVCRIAKVLAEYGESELMEVVACYPDFAMFRKTKDSFRLTRTQTLMNGGCCCDTCYHDVQYVKDFVHPSREVFASLDAMAQQADATT